MSAELTQWLLVLPVIIPLAAAIGCFLWRGRPRRALGLSVFAAALTLLAAASLTAAVLQHGVLSVALGGWPAPFGIVFVADVLAAIMALITAIIGLAVVVYAGADLAGRRAEAEYHLFMQVLLAGVAGAFLTGDIFNLYVWFEVMLIASFALLTLESSGRVLEGAVKYVALNLIATLGFLLAIGLLYGATGTLNLADLHARAAALSGGQSAVIAGLFLFAFAIKSGLFPLFAWLPAAYPTAPPAVVALFAALLTKVGVYALIRLFTLVFPLADSGYQPLLVAAAALTMLTGVLAAASQGAVRQILSFHIISQIGYMVMGLAVFTPLAVAGAVFYLVHHIIVKANLFLIGGVLLHRHDSDGLSRLGGSFRRQPVLAVLFLVPALSLAGIPPLSGFWGKFIVIRAGLETGYYVLSATALVVGLLTLYSMAKIWAGAFWKPAPAGQPDRPPGPRRRVLMYAPIVALAALTVTIGLLPEPFVRVAERAAAELMEPGAYVEAVLGRTP